MVAAGAVFRGEPHVVIGTQLERHGDGLLQRCGRADRHEVVNLSDRGGELPSGNDPSDPPTRYGEGFARARDGHGALSHAFEGRDRDVLAFVAYVLVDLIGHRDDVVVSAECRDGLELRPREHPARRVVRSVDDDRLCARGERAG